MGKKKKETVKEMIRRLIREGKPHKQAVEMAIKTAKNNKKK